MVRAGPEDGGGEDLAHHEEDGQHGDGDDHHLALAFGEGEVIPQVNVLLAGVYTQHDHEHQDIDQQQNKDKAVKAGIVQVDGGQGDIEPYRADDQGDQQTDEHPGHCSFCLTV